MRIAVLRLVILAAFCALLVGAMLGYIVRATFFPPVQVHTQQFQVITQELKLPQTYYCHGRATIVDPAAIWQFDNFSRCSTTPEPNVRYP